MTRLGGANLGDYSDANLNGIPDGKSLKQLIDSYNSNQTKIAFYERIIKDNLGFDPTSSDLNIQIKKQLDGVKLAEIPVSLKELVDKYNSSGSNDLRNKLAQAEKAMDDARKELKKYQDFVRKLVEKIDVADLHSKKNDLSLLEEDINDWLNDYKEEIETELLAEINALGLGLNEITKRQVFTAISELINKPNPNEALVEKLREQIRTQDLLITDYQNGENYMSKTVIENKMKETLKILKIPVSHYHQKIASARNLKEMGTSFEKLLREETNKQEQTRANLITLSVFLAILTISSLLMLIYGMIIVRQKNKLLKIEKMKKKRVK